MACAVQKQELQFSCVGGFMDYLSTQGIVTTLVSLRIQRYYKNNKYLRSEIRAAESRSLTYLTKATSVHSSRRNPVSFVSSRHTQRAPSNSKTTKFFSWELSQLFDQEMSGLPIGAKCRGSYSEERYNDKCGTLTSFVMFGRHGHFR